MCILLCRNISNDKITIPSAVDFPAFGFDINGNGMRYDLSATVHYKKTNDGNGHYTAISRSRDLQSQQWFMYDDDRVSSSNFTNKNTMVKKHIRRQLLFCFMSVPQLRQSLKMRKLLIWWKEGRSRLKMYPLMHSCFYPLNTKTTKLNGPTCIVATHMTLVRVEEWFTLKIVLRNSNGLKCNS